MKGWATWQTLGALDGRNLGRDAMLRWMIVIPVVAALGMRWLVPVLVATADPWLPLALASLYPPLMAYMLALLVPYLWGTIVGFLLLDQRDEGTLLALRVTPFSLRSYLGYRLLLPALFSLLTTLLVYPLAGLLRLTPGGLFLVAVAGAPQAPLAALALATLARNKVEGLALMKVANIVLLPPAVAYFLPVLWQWPFFLFPTYWPARLLWSLAAGSPLAPLWLVPALAHPTLLALLLARRLVSRASSGQPTT